MRTLLIIGAGDIAWRALPALRTRWRVVVLTRDIAKAARWREAGALPLLADLDKRASMQRLAGLADAVLYTAPPPERGSIDPRMRKVLSQLAKTASLPQQFVYISTSGVYGDAGGKWLDECSVLNPESDRAKRRVDAERNLRAFAIAHGTSLTILRAPGIYAAERLPQSRFNSRLPLIQHSEDSYSNHIHADDLAGICVAALQKPRAGIRIFNACDDAPMAIGEWYDLLADYLGQSRLPRDTREAVRNAVPPGLWSYMAESRRLSNQRLKKELLPVLRYPTVQQLLQQKTIR